MPFTIAVILVPDRGLPVSRLKEFFQPPPGVTVIFAEYARTDDPYDPSPNSMSNALIGLAPDRKVRVITDGTLLEKGQLYILAAGSNFDVYEGEFIPGNPVTPEARPYLLDYFLSRMAVAFTNRLVVVLADHTGMLGAQTVREEGGLVYLVSGAGVGRPPETWPLMDGTLEPGQFARRLAEARLPEAGNGMTARNHHQSVSDPRLGPLLEQEVLPLLCKNRRNNGPLRVWVAGTSDAALGYSAAISLWQYLIQRRMNLRMKVFVSHLNRRIMDRARTGVFEEASLIHMPAGDRDLYFTQKDNHTWKVVTIIQQLCIFATHHFVGDPPFAHCDLIVGCDSIRFLSEPDRDRLFRTFHYALNSHGFLLILPGISPTYKMNALFEPVAGISGLYTRVDRLEPIPSAPSSPRPLSEAERQADKILMTGYVPAAMLVDAQLRVIRFYGVMSPFLSHQLVRPSLHLLNIVRDDLIFDLSELLEEADRTLQPVAKDNIFLAEEGGPEYRLEVIPIDLNDGNNKLVVIKEKKRETAAYSGSGSPQNRDHHIKALERQVQKLRYQLQSANRLFKQTQENLQMVNEEMMSSNEELQCMNEELQILNNELQLLNDDLTARNRELEMAQRPASVGR